MRSSLRDPAAAGSSACRGTRLEAIATPARQPWDSVGYYTVTYPPVTVQARRGNGRLNWEFSRISDGWRCRPGCPRRSTQGHQLVPEGVGPGEVLGLPGPRPARPRAGPTPRRPRPDRPAADTPECGQRARRPVAARRLALRLVAGVWQPNWPPSPARRRRPALPACPGRRPCALGMRPARRDRRVAGVVRPRPRSPRPSARAGRRRRSAGPARRVGRAPSRHRPASGLSPRSGER